jgi:hypothetical protein
MASVENGRGSRASFAIRSYPRTRPCLTARLSSVRVPHDERRYIRLNRVFTARPQIAPIALLFVSVPRVEFYS